MHFRYYSALLFVGGSAALFGLGSLFGLGLLRAPPANQHKTVAVTATAAQADKPVKVDKKAEEAQRKADARLSPLYPTDLGPSGSQEDATKQTADTPANTGAPAAKQAANAAPKQTASPAPKQAAKAAEAEANQSKSATPAQHETTGAKAADEEPSSAPTPVSEQRPAHCAISACAAAYKSFRASDCTYQPYSGTRQLCVKPPSSQRGQVVKWRDRNSAPHEEDDDLSGAVEAVRRMTPGLETFDSEGPPPRNSAIIIDR